MGVRGGLSGQKYHHISCIISKSTLDYGVYACIDMYSWANLSLLIWDHKSAKIVNCKLHKIEKCLKCIDTKIQGSKLCLFSKTERIFKIGTDLAEKSGAQTFTILSLLNCIWNMDTQYIDVFCEINVFV